MSGIDYRALSRIADRVVVDLAAPNIPGAVLTRAAAEKTLWPLIREINSWKILLRIPVYALLWNLSRPDELPVRLSNQEAVARLYRHSARIRRDETGAQFYEFTERGTEYHLRLVQREVFHQVVALVNLHNLAGVVLDRLGMEDARLWQVLRSHFRTTHL